MNLHVVFLMFVVIGVTARADDNRPQHDHADGPLKAYTPEAIAGAVKLRDALTDTVWSYHYRDGKFKVGFGSGGDVQLLKSWSTVRWRLAGPREVILESGRDYMILRFDNSLRHFWTTDWDGQEATGRKTDARMPGAPPATRKSVSNTNRKLAPPRVDLRPEFKRRQLGVRQQGQRGSCQVLAFVGVLEYQLSRPDAPVDLSEQFLMWAANESNGVKRTEGFNVDLLIVGLKKHGICREALMPYVPRNAPIDEPSAKAMRDGRERAEVPSLRSSTGPPSPASLTRTFKRFEDTSTRARRVTATICWPEGLPNSQIVDANQLLIDRAVDGRSKSGHGVILCGYGLDEQTPGGGYFIFRNSWGPEFADKGYARLTFAYARQYGVDAYIVSIQ